MNTNLPKLVALAFCAMAISCLEISAQDVGAEWVIKPNMTGFEEFNYNPDYNNQVIVTINGKKGVVNADNKIIVPAEYERMMINPGGMLISAGRKDLERDDAYNERGEKVNEGYEDCHYVNDGIFFVKRNGKYGIIDLYRRVIFPPVYDRIDGATGGAYNLIKGSEITEWKRTPMKEYVESKNKSKTTPAAKKEEEGPIPGYKVLTNKVSKNETRFGFSNMNGETVVPPIYYLGPTNSAGYAFVSHDGKKWGFIDMNNKVLLDFEYEKVRDLPANMQVPLKKDGKMGVLQLPEGKVVLPFEYEHIEIANRKKARAYVVKKDGLVGLLDADGKYLLPLEFSSIINDFKQNTTVLKKNGLFGTWSPFSDKYTEPVYKGVFPPRPDSICAVQKDSLWALLNSVQARELTSFKYDRINQSGIFYIGEYKQGGQVMRHLLYNDGTEVMPAESASFYGFTDGSCFVKRAEISIHIDAEGHLIREYKDKSTNVFDSQWISSKNADGTPTYIHATCKPGKEIWLESVGKLSDGVRVCKHKGKFGYMNESGEWVLKPVFDNAMDNHNGYLRVKYKGKWGVLKSPVSK